MKRHIFLYGFSIFSMFFGSGNLVFPLMVGVNNADNWLAGFIGFFCTGIVLPFLGLFVIKLHRGNYESFFGEAGSIAKFAIPFFTLSLLGAFGVIPRCITVAHGGLEFLYNNISLLSFSFIFCAACYIICLNEKLMFNILGKFLTPILLLFLSVLIIVGIYSSTPMPTDYSATGGNFIDGFFQGYATMDLFASFFFSSLIFKQIEVLIEESNEHSIIKAALGPSIFGAALLGIIYFGFVYLGSHYKHLATGLPGELILPAIANHLLGKNGALFIAIIIIFSCLTTAVALNSIYTKYLCTFKSIGNRKFKTVLLATTALSFIISLLDFDGIAAILGPLLEISYPGLIVLTIISICTKKHQSLKMISFYAVIAFMLLI
ncbi:MAG: branched-chain amino acid transport system II carrier protein [Rickettsiaceae bacterium]|nr:branched-chain amino acid transport system II carrier protein [Rickettsiaceae bacterium]